MILCYNTYQSTKLVIVWLTAKLEEVWDSGWHREGEIRSWGGNSAYLAKVGKRGSIAGSTNLIENTLPGPSTNSLGHAYQKKSIRIIMDRHTLRLERGNGLFLHCTFFGAQLLAAHDRLIIVLLQMIQKKALENHFLLLLSVSIPQYPTPTTATTNLTNSNKTTNTSDFGDWLGECHLNIIVPWNAILQELGALCQKNKWSDQWAHLIQII